MINNICYVNFIGLTHRSVISVKPLHVCVSFHSFHIYGLRASGQRVSYAVQIINNLGLGHRNTTDFI